MKFTDEELNIIVSSLRGTLSRIGNDEQIERLINKIMDHNVKSHSK